VATRWWMTWGLLCLILLTGCASVDESPQARFELLFDGETFDGWEGNLEVFRIEGKAIVGGSLEKAVAHNDFLCTEQEYSDFELRLQVKLLGEQANAGIQFRTKRIPDHYEVSGYQADMGQQYWGCLYDESRRNKVLAGISKEQAAELVRAGQWNDYIIRCQGDRIQLWLNGTLTVDYTETDPSIERTGIIALQIHGGPPSEAWYRNIRIKTLH